MIDIHCHILPGLDDGAQSMDEAVEIARAAQADGVDAMVATPHGEEWGAGCTQEQAEERVEVLRRRLKTEGVAVQIYPGLENYIAPDLPQQLAAGTAFTLNRTPYFLVELPLQGFPLYTEQVLFELQTKGLIPIIAHPERNSVLHVNHDLLRGLVERGMFAQVTAASLVGAFGARVKQAAESMLRGNLVHIIASDAHSSKGSRSPVLSEAVKVAAKIVGTGMASAMVNDIPRAMLAGEELTVEPPMAAKTRKSWVFWR